MDVIRFTLILPVFHGGPFLERALASALRLNSPPDRFELLVSAHVHDEAAKRIVESQVPLAPFHLECVPCPTDNRSAMLNLACARAKGEILVFSDDDCAFPADWLAKIDAIFQNDPSAGIVGGEDELARDARDFDHALDWVIRSLATSAAPATAGWGAGRDYPKLWNLAIRRDLALSLGLPGRESPLEVFDESLAVHEDIDLAKRAQRSGNRIIFAPDVRVEHSRDTTLLSFFRRSFRMARTARALRVHRLPHVVLSAFLLAGAALLALSIFLRSAQPVLVVLLSIYALALLAAGVAAASTKQRVCALFWVPVLLIALHLARGTGYLFPWPSEKAKDGTQR
ncbi:MAG: glycosyltransferase [Planctomycetota bacterium]